MVNYSNYRLRATRRIRKTGMIGALRRVTTDRQCYLVNVDLRASERAALTNPTNRVFLIAVKDPKGNDLVAPDWQQDKVVIYEQPLASTPVVKEVLDLVAPQAPLAPAGVIVYWEVQVKG